MEEKIRRAIDHMQATDQRMAESQAPRAIGLMAVALHQQGQPVTRQLLVDALLAAVQHRGPTHLERMQHEAAARLLGWIPEPGDG